MLIPLRSLKLVCWTSLAALLSACGNEGTAAVATDDDNEGGASAVQAFPPALGPQDCASSTSKIALSQPDGAAVWGGLAVLEFDVEGAKVDTFDVQQFDPSLGVWLNDASVQLAGQRNDGSYFLAVQPSFTEETRDQKLKLRVRPTQGGCPDADWTETSSFSATDPLLGSSWMTQVPAAAFASHLELLRTPVDVDLPPTSSPVVLGDAGIVLDFGDDGVLTENLTVAVSTEEDEPYDGCTLNFVFTGTYRVSFNSRYGGPQLSISELVLDSAEETSCDSPRLKEMALSAKDFDVRLPAQPRQSFWIDYVPTLLSTPRQPRWQTSVLGQFLQNLPAFMSYQTATESGSVSGYVNVQDIEIARQ